MRGGALRTWREDGRGGHHTTSINQVGSLIKPGKADGAALRGAARRGASAAEAMTC